MLIQTTEISYRYLNPSVLQTSRCGCTQYIRTWKQYGYSRRVWDLDDIVNLDGVLVSVSEVESGTSGSVPFVGNAIGLVSDDEEPFLSTYSVNGMAKEGRIVNDITNILNSTSTTLADGEVKEEEEEEDEQEGN